MFTEYRSSLYDKKKLALRLRCAVYVKNTEFQRDAV